MISSQNLEPIWVKNHSKVVISKNSTSFLPFWYHETVIKMVSIFEITLELNFVQKFHFWGFWAKIWVRFGFKLVKRGYISTFWLLFFSFTDTYWNQYGSGPSDQLKNNFNQNLGMETVYTFCIQKLYKMYTTDVYKMYTKGIQNVSILINFGIHFCVQD